jgi:2,4-dienoyl-CoA reductase (NADPH2)
VGVETALFLAEKGTLSGDVLKYLLVQRAEDPERLYQLAIKGAKEVTIVEMLPKLGVDIGKSTRWAMMKALKTLGIKARTETKVLEITDAGVKVKKGKEVSTVEADSVVLALGAAPENPLAQVVAKKDIPHAVVGDAAEIKRAFDAIHNGFMAGCQI